MIIPVEVTIRYPFELHLKGDPSMQEVMDLLTEHARFLSQDISFEELDHLLEDIPVSFDVQRVVR